MSDTNPYMPLSGTIEKIIDETPTIKTFVVRPEQAIPFRAGQFMQLTVPGVGEAPFTPSSSPSKPETMDFTVIRAGHVTDELHLMGEGDLVGLRGPFGKGYPIEKLEGHDVLVVGGGCGLAPLRSLLYTLFENSGKFKTVSIKYGAKTPDDLVYHYSFDDWAKKEKVSFDTTVDAGGGGWKGNVGPVTVILDKKDVGVDIDNSYAVACGPEIMLKFVTLKLLDIGYPPERIYLSMNRRMSCGTGKCGRCNIGPYYVCKDGPDFCYATIMDYPNVFGM